MSNTKSSYPIGREGFRRTVPARTPGSLGIKDAADPNVDSDIGDTPGPIGFNDAAQALAEDPLRFHQRRI